MSSSQALKAGSGQDSGSVDSESVRHNPCPQDVHGLLRGGRRLYNEGRANMKVSSGDGGAQWKTEEGVGWRKASQRVFLKRCGLSLEI